MPAYTARLGLPYPEPTDPPDVPQDLSELANAIDAYISTMKIPVGTVIGYVGSTAPTGWALCDGKPHGSSRLEAFLGSKNAPDLQERFIKGIGDLAAAEAGRFGGARTVTLTEANMASHSHAASTSAAGGQGHGHTGVLSLTVGGGGHVHDVPPQAAGMQYGIHQLGAGGLSAASAQFNKSGSKPSADGGITDLTASDAAPDDTPAHSHTVNYTPAGSSPAAEGPHSHAGPSGTTAVGGGAAHGGPPPYYVVTFLIKV